MKGTSNYTLLSPAFSKSLPSREKYLTRHLICINIIQHEEVGSRESKVTEGDPILFRNASGEPGGFISQMWKERVSM